MLKTKQRRSTNSSGRIFGSSDSVIDFDLQGDDSWVIVKRQKITILVPPLTIVQKSQTPDSGQSQLQPTSVKIPNCQSQSGDNETCQEILPSTLPLAPKKLDQQSWKSAPAQKDHTLERPAMRVPVKNRDQVGYSRSCKVFGVLNTKSFKHPRQLHGPGAFISGGTLLNQSQRVLNLERKLQKAGGLSRWLVSLGLQQFVGIFQRRCINKFQLVNLTMKKLKDMGANAVGPRRKLMHAIDCVCQPYHRSEAFDQS